MFEKKESQDTIRKLMKKPQNLIRRKFILLTAPSTLTKQKGIEQEEGFVASSSLRDLRLRRSHRSYFISFREKQTSLFHCKDIKISKDHFESLWPFTEGKRIKSRRYLFELKKREVKVDCFVGDHAPLQLIEVFFPTRKASLAFKKPKFFGDEVTNLEVYDTEGMAFHGVPEPFDKCQIGVLPYLIRRGKLHILLVTSSSGQRWIIPKGHQEIGMTPHEVAAMEAVEEGGILGTLHHDLHLRCQMANGRFLQLYAMKISKLLSSWPEQQQRLRRLVSIPEALRLIDDPEIARAVKRLAERLRG